MNFELGKDYIVKVSEEGVIPIEEFDESRFYDKDHDDLDFLTNEEKIVVINDVLNKIRAELEQLPITDTAVKLVTEIIDKYKAKSEG